MNRVRSQLWVLYQKTAPPLLPFRFKKDKMDRKERAKIKAEIRAEIKNRKLQKTDGLGPLEIKKIRTALRLVWQRSYSRKLVVLRCTDKAGFTFCELCLERTPGLKVDHIEQVGEVGPEYIYRLFVPSVKMQGLCKTCHDVKTNIERKGKRLKRVKDWGF